MIPFHEVDSMPRCNGRIDSRFWSSRKRGPIPQQFDVGPVGPCFRRDDGVKVSPSKYSVL